MLENVPDNWTLETLEPETQALVYAVMRNLEDRVIELQKEHRWLSPVGSLAVGTQHLEPFWESECIIDYLGYLRRGHTPTVALLKAREDSIHAMKIHNKYHDDYITHRDEKHCFSILDSIHYAICSPVRRG